MLIFSLALTLLSLDLKKDLLSFFGLHEIFFQRQHLYVVVVSGDEALLCGFEAFLVDALRLVIEETVGVSGPSHSAQEYHVLRLLRASKEREALSFRVMSLGVGSA